MSNKVFVWLIMYYVKDSQSEEITFIFLSINYKWIIIILFCFNVLQMTIVSMNYLLA